MNRLNGQHVLVLGLGESGLAMARWSARCGAQVTVADTRESPPGLAKLQSELPGVRVVMGAFDQLPLEGVQRVLKSPGLSPLAPDTSALLKRAEGLGIARMGELSLFCEALADLHAERGYASKVIAVTGTNGKTTVTALTAELVARAGRRVQAAGNISPSLLDALSARLDEAALPEVWVLELSSFQLDDTGLSAGVPSFDASVVLNLSQDHLDWHGSFEHYARAKSLIYGEQGVCVMNRDDTLVMQMAPSAAGTTANSGKASRISQQAQRAAQARVVTFGLGAPQRPGDFGCVTEGGMAWLVRAHEADETRRRKVVGPASDDDEVSLQRLMPADALRIRGRHNAANALAALALAHAAGCPMAPMLHGLREYRGEPHRAQWVARVGEVDFIDDSKGTNVGATVAAIEGLGADQGLVLILGGQGKGQDFTPLAAPVARHVRAVMLIGQDAEQIATALAPAVDAGVSLQRCTDLPTAVRAAAAAAQPGQAVLLSPACASFDMFEGYAHRAAVFVQAVRGLADDRGEVMA